MIIDDFVGSGDTIVNNIKEYFIPEFCLILKERKIITIFGIVTGFSEAKEIIERKINKLGIDAIVIIIDILDDSDKCFSDSSRIFVTPSEKRKVKHICQSKGELLEEKYPLGYSDSQTIIAFPMNCPNNTLPIFWKETKNWVPIFKRTYL
ncbi:hypothetical protein EZS27_028130 [termite gut metagenome]|uniref:PRTase-CE domain-containing protein n=1 Tax=termite gut metagenome TaxID=433724 RepID=A0A5J4QNR0_9ZZZZ